MTKTKPKRTKPKRTKRERDLASATATLLALLGPYGGDDPAMHGVLARLEELLA